MTVMELLDRIFQACFRMHTLFLAKCPIASWIFLMLAMRLFFVSLKTLIPRSTSTSVSKTSPSFDPLTRLETLTGGFACRKCFVKFRIIKGS